MQEYGLKELLSRNTGKHGRKIDAKSKNVFEK